MIITKITIQNFLCYYGRKEFNLSPGLNIVLGENGEGKTKFFEAVDWLLNGDSKNLETLVSAKAIHETEIHGEISVSVSMTVEQFGEKLMIKRSFIAKKDNEQEVQVFNNSIEGIEENKSGERIPVDGKNLLERVFPSEIRRYSMFKGESELDIFKNEEALGILINSFSSAKHFDKYAEKGLFLRERAEKAVDEATRKDTKSKQEYKRLEAEISRLSDLERRLKQSIENLQTQIKKTDENIQEADKYVENADALETVNSRIQAIEEKIRSTSNMIDENYSTALLDEQWILMDFEALHAEYMSKVKSLDKTRRQLQSEFDKEQGKLEAKQELANTVIQLPLGVPTRAHMEEMLAEEICKVCNRKAEIGSEAYNFMLKRLNDYLESQKPAKPEAKQSTVLFQHNYINRLFTLGVMHEDNLVRIREIRQKISDLFEFNDLRKSELVKLNENLEKETKDRDKIIGASKIAAEKLVNVQKNYRGWQADLKALNKELITEFQKLSNVQAELSQNKALKDNIDTQTASTFLLNTRAILRDVEQIFRETKESKFQEFIEKLQIKSNVFFDQINIESFTGQIVFVPTKIGNKSSVAIELQEEGGSLVHRPNQSLLTSMHISVLFAISELAAEMKEEKYPLIFDAPTSSFGETKTAEFLNLIFETDNQKILLVKDFLELDESSRTLKVKSEFKNVKRDKAFWIQLERPFDRKNLKTINTQVIEI